MTEEQQQKKHRRYHTKACGMATTKRCRCVCGGARHGELLKSDNDKEEKEEGAEDVVEV
jgi:hypothetical protein